MNEYLRKWQERVSAGREGVKRDRGMYLRT